jgi:hypothetical protein
MSGDWRKCTQKPANLYSVKPRNSILTCTHHAVYCQYSAAFSAGSPITFRLQGNTVYEPAQLWISEKFNIQKQRIIYWKSWIEKHLPELVWRYQIKPRPRTPHLTHHRPKHSSSSVAWNQRLQTGGSVHRSQPIYTQWNPEPEFLNILKCDLAESASAGFQFNCYDIFCNDKTLYYKHVDHFLRTVKLTEKNLLYHKQKL